MTTMTGRLVTVKLKRNNQEAPAVTIFEHEMLVLRSMHGESCCSEKSIVPPEEGGIDPRLVKLNAEDEWQRLINKYGAHPQAAMSTAEYTFNRDINNLVRAGHKSKKVDEDWSGDRIQLEKDKTDAATKANAEAAKAAAEAEAAEAEGKARAGKKRSSKSTDVSAAEEAAKVTATDEVVAKLDELLIDYQAGAPLNELQSDLQLGVMEILDDQGIEYDVEAPLENLLALVPEGVTAESDPVDSGE